MKINKLIYPIIASIILIFSACEPIVEEEHLENNTNAEGVSIKATQSTPGGNEITIDMTTPGITGHWDYNLGKALTNRTTIIYPIPGKATFTYVGTLGAEFFTKTIDIQIDKLDHPLAQDWYDLVGTNTPIGKTWVFDKAIYAPATEPYWWFMSAPDNPDGAMGSWWNAGACCAPSDANGKIHFDLDGAANYTYHETASATGTKGSFVLDVANQKLIITGAPILGAERANSNGVFTIISLTENKLVLYTPRTPQGDSGWTWVFKPE